MEARNRNLKDWLTRVRTRQISLPRFQRFEAWQKSFVRDLLSEILNGLPIGSALVLGVGEKLPFISREIVGAPRTGEKITELLLDGQQRLTAIWRSINDSYPEDTYLVNIPKPPEQLYVYSEGRWERNGKRYPLWVDQPKECWDKRNVPLRLLNPDNESEYKTWAKSASNGDKDAEIEIRDLVSDLRHRIANYQLPFLYLEPTTPREIAIDVFIKLNTRYVRLTPFDIVVAQVEEHAQKSLHDLVDSLKYAAPEITNFINPSDIVLPFFSLLQNVTPSQKGFLSLDFKGIVNDWPRIEEGTKNALNFLREEGIIDGKRLPSEVVLAPLAVLWSEVPKNPDEIGNLRILLRKYVWRAFFTARYDRSVSTALIQDYRTLRDVIEGKIKEEKVPCFNELDYPLPEEQQLIQARWPRYRDHISRGLLLLSLRGGAEDISDGATISINNINNREYHHLYPVDWLEKKGIEEDLSYRALNCVLVTWKTNRKISAKEPISYLRERCEASSLGKDEIMRRLKTHFVEYEHLASGDYEEFLKNRAIECKNAINSLCNGKAWKPSI